MRMRRNFRYCENRDAKPRRKVICGSTEPEAMQSTPLFCMNTSQAVEANIL